MASIEDRWHNKRTGEKSSRYGIGKRWVLRWRDPDGALRKISYTRKTDAQEKRKEIEGDMLRGSYVDPKAGTITFDAFASEWLAHRTSDPLTIEETAKRLRRHVTGTPFGTTPLAKIRPSTVQAWVKGVAVGPSTTRVVFDHVSSILAAAVDDGVIGRNPAGSKTVTPPKRTREKVIPWTHQQVARMHTSIIERYQPLVTLGAGLGLRAGEVAGLSPDDVDWLRGWVTIQRQVKIVGNRRVFAPPKGGKTRSVPLSSAVRDELAAYLRTYPPREITLPWHERDGAPTTVRLMVTNKDGRALHSSSVTAGVWRPALDKADISRTRNNGTHALRHYYASVLIDAGESIKAVAEYLGHADESFTLKTYVHLMPESDTRTRSAIDAAFRALADAGVDEPDAGAH